MTFNRYYVSYPLCCPSRVSLLTGRYAHNHGVRGNVQPNGGYSGFASRGGLHPQPRHLAAGRRLPHDPHRQVPQRLRRRTVRQRHDSAAGLERLAHGPQRRHRPLLLRLHAQQQRRDRRPLRRLGQLGNPRIRRPRRHRLPLRAAQRPALLLRDRQADQLATEEIARNPARTALLPAARLHRPARRLPPPGRPGAGAAPLRLVQGRAAAPQPLGRLRRGQRHRQAALHPRSALPRRSATSHTYRVYWEKQLESLRAVDDGVKQIVDTLGASTGCATPTSSSPPTTASSSASTACSAASSSPTSPPPTCPS